MMITVRRVGPDDATALSNVALRSLMDSPAAFGRTLEEEQRNLSSYYDTLASRFGSSERTTAFLLFVGDRLMGTTGAFLDEADPSVAYVCATWIDPACRRRGAGRRLVDAAVAWVRGRGARIVQAWVADGNVGGRAFWNSVGFRASSVTQPHPARLGESETLYVCEQSAAGAVPSSEVRSRPRS